VRWKGSVPNPSASGGRSGPYLAAVAALVETASQALNLVGVLVIAGDDGALAGAANCGVFPDGSKAGWREPRGGVGDELTPSQ